MPFTFRAHGASDVGLVRTNNEDVWFSSPETGLFIVADGLGGHQAGEVAAKEAVDQFFSSFRRLTREGHFLEDEDIIASLKICFEKTNEHLYQLASHHDLLKGMGTTFCSLSFHGKKAALSHVGDSRVYRLRDEELEQLTHDHCWTRRFADSEISETEPLCKGVLTRAIGTTSHVEPTIHLLEVKHSDLFLLCSDGLSDMLTKREIRHVMKLPLTLAERVRMLISVAKQKGGVDNITCILVEVVGI